MTELPALIMVGAATEPGGPFSIVKILSIVALILPWLYTATWIYKDAARVRTNQPLWAGLVFGAGAASVFLWMLMPWYAAGLVIYLTAVGVVAGAYVSHRNKRVVPEARVLTAEHLNAIFTSRKTHRVQAVQRIKLYDGAGRPALAPLEDEQDKLRAHNLVQEFLHDVVLFRASEVDMAPTGAQASVRFMVDGVLQQRPAEDIADAETIIDFIKDLAKLDVSDKRRPQSGKIGVQAGAVMVDMEVATAGTTRGQRMQLRIVQEATRTDIAELGMPEDLLGALKKFGDEGGLVIVSGAAGSGVTSTLYSLLRSHDAFTQQLVSLEADPVVDLENITQNRYKDQADLPANLTSLLRREPDVVMVDSCKTVKSADLICKAAAEIRLLLGCRAGSALAALAKWIQVSGDARKAVTPLKAVTCQVLLRKICPQCKEAYRPPRDLLAKLNLPAEKIDTFYRPPTRPLTDEKGNPFVCPTCSGTGYYGRTGSFELLEMTDEIRELVVDGASLSRIKAACRKNKMLYLQEQSVQKVIEGVTSIDEVIRVSKKKS